MVFGRLAMADILYGSKQYQQMPAEAVDDKARIFFQHYADPDHLDALLARYPDKNDEEIIAAQYVEDLSQKNPAFNVPMTAEEYLSLAPAARLEALDRLTDPSFILGPNGAPYEMQIAYAIENERIQQNIYAQGMQSFCALTATETLNRQLKESGLKLSDIDISSELGAHEACAPLTAPLIGKTGAKTQIGEPTQKPAETHFIG